MDGHKELQWLKPFSQKKKPSGSIDLLGWFRAVRA
jgi:hypothetical protein